MPTLHLVASAGSCRSFYDAMGFQDGAELVDWVAERIGDRFRVTADLECLNAVEEPDRGGRNDDDRRARDLTRALGDDRVRGILALRGGAWLTRLLPRLDLGAMARRTAPVALFGFSEWTTLVNILSTLRRGRAVLDMGPAFLTYGLKRFGPKCQTNDTPAADPTDRAARWRGLVPRGRRGVERSYFARLRLRGEDESTSRPGEYARPCHPFGPKCQTDDTRADPTDRAWIAREMEVYFDDVAAILRGRTPTRTAHARLIQGAWPDANEVVFTGGNLAVLTALLGGRFQSCILPRRSTPRPKENESTRGTTPFEPADLSWISSESVDRASTSPGSAARASMALDSTGLESLLNPDALSDRWDRAQRFLILEDINEPIYRLDRFLAMLTLAGAWDHFGGILLGNFHNGPDDQLEAVLRLLPHHLPDPAALTIATCERIGHVWPMAPIPLHHPVRLHPAPDGHTPLDINWRRFME